MPAIPKPGITKAQATSAAGLRQTPRQSSSKPLPIYRAAGIQHRRAESGHRRKSHAGSLEFEIYAADNDHDKDRLHSGLPKKPSQPIDPCRLIALYPRTTPPLYEQEPQPHCRLLPSAYPHLTASSGVNVSTLVSVNQTVDLHPRIHHRLSDHRIAAPTPSAVGVEHLAMTLGRSPHYAAHI